MSAATASFATRADDTGARAPERDRRRSDEPPTPRPRPSRPPGPPPAFRAAGLVHVYREAETDVAALRGIDLTVPPGQRVALLGPSGSGKSTLLSIAAGLMRPSAGIASVWDQDLGAAGPADLERLRRDVLGLMLQGADVNLIAHESAHANVAWTVRGTPGRDVSLGERVLAGRRGAGRRAPRRPALASQRQTAALAVALASRPRLLLADEPTSRLDDHAREALLDLLVTETEREGIAVLLVTHDERVARRMQRMIHLRDGRVGEEDSGSGRRAVVTADGSVPIPRAPARGVAGGSPRHGRARRQSAAWSSDGPRTTP